MTPEELHDYNVKMTAGMGPLDIMTSKKNPDRIYFVDHKTNRILTEEPNGSHKLMEIDVWEMHLLETTGEGGNAWKQKMEEKSQE